MKKALLIVDIKTHFAEFMRLADALAKEGEYEPVFCLAYSDYSYCCIPHPIDYAKFLDQCVEKGYEVVNLEDSKTKESLIQYISQHQVASRVNNKYLFRYLEQKPEPFMNRIKAKTSGGIANKLKFYYDDMLIKLSESPIWVKLGLGWIILLLVILVKILSLTYLFLKSLFSVVGYVVKTAFSVVGYVVKTIFLIVSYVVKTLFSTVGYVIKALFSILWFPFELLYSDFHPHSKPLKSIIKTYYDKQYNALRNYVLSLEESPNQNANSLIAGSRKSGNLIIRDTRRFVNGSIRDTMRFVNGSIRNSRRFVNGSIRNIRLFGNRVLNSPRYFVRSLIRIQRNFINKHYGTFLKVMNVYSRFVYYGYYLDYIPKLLIENDIDVIVLPEDNVSYGAPIWVKCANDLNVPSVIMPYTIANATEAAKVLSEDPQYVANKGHRFNWFISKLYPKWTYRYEDKILLRRPGVDVWMMEYYDVSTPNPWLFYSTHADALFIENQAMQRYHIESGVAKDNMIITGAAYDDTLANYLHNKEAYRDDLYQELDLKPDKPMLLVALPPSIQPDKLPNVDDFEDFDEIVEFWMGNCGKIEGWNVVISLHPSLSHEDYKFIEKWGVKISKRDVSQLIAMSDIYLACVSATIRLAVACGIPVINYDVFRFRYDDYVGIEGVFAVEERDDFVAKLQELTSNENSLKPAKELT